MTRRDMNALRDELLRQKARLVNRVTAAENEVRDSDIATGDEDQIDRAYTRELLLTLSNCERGQLSQIDKAIEQIRQGAYGVCMRCREQIALKRLQAAPWARFCLNCQQIQEQRGGNKAEYWRASTTM